MWKKVFYFLKREKYWLSGRFRTLKKNLSIFLLLLFRKMAELELLNKISLLISAIESLYEKILEINLPRLERDEFLP